MRNQSMTIWIAKIEKKYICFWRIIHLYTSIGTHEAYTSKQTKKKKGIKLTWNPSYVQDPNFISHRWSSNGNHVMSILHVDLNIPGGTYKHEPLLRTTTFVGYVPSNPSSALQNRKKRKIIWRTHVHML